MAPAFSIVYTADSGEQVRVSRAGALTRWETARVDGKHISGSWGVAGLAPDMQCSWWSDSAEGPYSVNCDGGTGVWAERFSALLAPGAVSQAVLEQATILDRAAHCYGSRSRVKVAVLCTSGDGLPLRLSATDPVGRSSLTETLEAIRVDSPPVEADLEQPFVVGAESSRKISQSDASRGQLNLPDLPVLACLLGGSPVETCK